MEQTLDLIRTAGALAVFVYASWRDYKTREVSNRVWLISAPPLLLLTALQLALFSPQLLPQCLFSMAFTSIISVLLFYSSAFGGADAKALITLALAIPVRPVGFGSLLPPSLIAQTAFPLTALANAVALEALLAGYYLAKNLCRALLKNQGLFIGLDNRSAALKLLLVLTGYPTKFKELVADEFLLPLERVEEREGMLVRTICLRPDIENRDAEVERLGKLVGPEDPIWVTPGLPFLVFILLGLILGLVVGDVFALVLPMPPTR